MAGKEAQMSAVDELIRQRGIETESTRVVDKMKETIVEDNKERVIELCKLSRENLQNQVDASLIELMIDDRCEDDCKALSGKEYAIKTNIFNTKKRIDTITTFINDLERSDDNGSVPEAD